MSYIMFRQGCYSCLAEWNASFGVVGKTQIGHQAEKCPKCGSQAICFKGNGWRMGDGTLFPTVSESAP